MTSAEAASWAEAAAGWERRRAFIAEVGAPVTDRLVALLDPRPDETILELACGTGEVGLAVAPHVGHGQLVQSDFSPEMVEAARRAAAERGVRHVTHRVLDVDRLELPDESVDGIVCRWGYMLAADPVGALAESRRVLRPGGRTALAIWAESELNPWGTAVGRALLEHGLIDVPDRDAPGPFRLGRPGLLESAISAAGLELVSTEDVAVEWRVLSAESFWEIAVDLSTATRRVADEAGAHAMAGVRRRVDELLAPYVAEHGLVIPGVSRVALARRAL